MLVMQKVLIVDDEPQILDVVSKYLTRDGFEIATARDGEAALTAFHTNKPDLVILDLMLPKLDGLEVFRRMRSLSAIPVIMLTAKGEETDRIVGLELGADDYITKPFSPRELVARVKAVLRRATRPSSAPRPPPTGPSRAAQRAPTGLVPPTPIARCSAAPWALGEPPCPTRSRGVAPRNGPRPAPRNGPQAPGVARRNGPRPARRSRLAPARD